MQTHRIALATALLAGSLSAQYASSSVAYNFIDIAASGTSLGLSGTEDGGASLPIGFNFDFYDTTITSIAATTNGYLTTGTNLTEWIPDCPLPNSLEPNGVIAPNFDDLSLVNSGEIFYETLGSAPNRITVVQWENSGAFQSSFASATFQVQLFEADSSIQYHYESLSDTSGAFPILGDNAFVGVESPAGDSAEVIHCIDGAPVFTPGVTAYLIEQQFPYIVAPALVTSGNVFNVPGVADPATLYVFAWSLGSGPIGPIPILENITLNLGFNFKLAGTGLTPASGDIASDSILAPAGFGGTVVNWQAVTIAGFGPISGVKVSNPDTVTLRDGVTFTGTIPTIGVSDHYAMPVIAGDVVTIEHCRTDNTGGSGSTLDCYLCLEDPMGVVEATDDDGGGDCFVTGPFGASLLEDHTILMSGTYIVYASSFQGIAGGETGDYELTIIGPTSVLSTVLLMDDGPICPGQPFLNPASKLQAPDRSSRR